MIALADCAVVVSDAKEAARWWVDKLGFATHTVGGGEHAVMVAPPGDRFVVHLCQGVEGVQPGNTGIAFVTDEIDRVVARMERLGVDFPEPLKKESWGSMAKFADPDGNVYWLLGASTTFVQREARRTAPRAVARRRPASARRPKRGARGRSRARSKSSRK